jgi:hypothetical protein
MSTVTQKTKRVSTWEFGPALLIQHPSAPVVFQHEQQDPREQRVLPAATETPVPIDLYRATPESIAHAKAKAAEERAQVDAEFAAYDAKKARAMAQLRELTQEFGPSVIQMWVQDIKREGR